MTAEPAAMACGCPDTAPVHRDRCRFAGQSVTSYPWIAVYAKHTGLVPAAAAVRAARARHDHAPPDAYAEATEFGRHTGRWRTVDEIRDPVMRAALGLPDG